ncbi:hypothetical protein [Streptomyces sp. WM4235]|uniref:hypothetical protein n=1 Tax=Streptomyces sp. WM4235 TaxID=1415551 RepID=UPI00131B1791|nr:hypothetical protein [Streptomyces sp. WM4235]
MGMWISGRISICGWKAGAGWAGAGKLLTTGRRLQPRRATVEAMVQARTAIAVATVRPSAGVVYW